MNDYRCSERAAGAPDLQVVLLQFVDQRLAGYAQLFGGQALVVVGLLQH